MPIDRTLQDSDSDLSLFEVNMELTGRSLSPAVAVCEEETNTTSRNARNGRELATFVVRTDTDRSNFGRIKPDITSLLSSSGESDVEMPLISKKGKQPANKSKKAYIKRTTEPKK